MLSFFINSKYTKKSIYLLYFFILSPFFLNGQEFEWVYSTKGVVNQNDYIPSAMINRIIINSNNDVYITGSCSGYVNFGDGFFNSLLVNIGGSFVAKLNENKEVIWIKFLRHTYYSINDIILDENDNIIVCGSANPHTGKLYFDSNPPNPNFPLILSPTHENLDTSNQFKIYGFVYRLDSNGNYINSRIFEDIVINDLEKDLNNNILIAGNSLTYTNNPIKPYFNKWGHLCKMKTSFDSIWEKVFNNQNSNSRNALVKVSCDSQNNIYCSGTYFNNFLFNGTILQQEQSLIQQEVNSNFICKLSANGIEDWITGIQYNSSIQNPTYNSLAASEVKIDSADNLYFYINYESNMSIQFNNTIIENFPLNFGYETALFKLDNNGNYIWHKPIYGSGNQKIDDFKINNLDELIVPVKSEINSEFYYSDQNIQINNNNLNVSLLKIKLDGELIDYKGILESQEIDFFLNYNYVINTDNNSNIYIGGYFSKPVDFDPNVVNQHILIPDFFENGDTGVFYPEKVGYVLKLKNCESLPFFGDTYEFCSGTFPNPTIGDIKESGPNVKFYASMSDITPLAGSFQLSHGQTIYYENNVSSCSNIGRFPLQIIILPKSNPPIVSAVQPCFYQELQLADIDVQGQNLLFYLNPSGGESVSENLYLNPNSTYYVTQNYNNCESNRIPFSVYQMTLLTDSHTATFCDEDKNDVEIVNLTDYLEYYTGSTANGFSGIYFNSQDDAMNNQNPISNYETFQATNQTVFIRVFSNNSGCFEIVELNLSLVYPTEITEIKVEDLVENNTVTILPYDENFSYSLDGINYQSSNVFNNVSSGEYYAYLKDDTADCSSISNPFYVLTYPKFFTPNGDGINDFWRIKMSQFQYAIDVEIYDRYGKFITNFDKNSGGWDGRDDEKALPATDYWFKIIRITDKKIIYRGHFSLKR